MENPSFEENQTVQSQEAPASKSNSKVIVGVVLIAVVVIISVLALEKNKFGEEMKENTVKEETAKTQEGNSVSPMAQGTYKDGSYTVKGDYTSPAGPEQIDVKLTLKDNIVVDSEVKVLSENKISKGKQTSFADGYKTLVVGKNINELNLDKVSGASLTTKGFNNALEKIKTEAKI